MDKSVKFWDRLSKNYDGPDTINKVNEYTSIKYTKQYLNGNDKVLDFGCATGTIAASIANQVGEVYGIDISPKMIRIAEERAQARAINNIHFSPSSIFDELFEKSSFDVILAFSILHLLKDTEKAIRRIHELLKPGGYFICLTPCLGEKKFIRTLLSLIYKIGILPAIRCFTISELESTLIHQKFELVKSECLDDNPLEYFSIAKRY